MPKILHLSSKLYHVSLVPHILGLRFECQADDPLVPISPPTPPSCMISQKNRRKDPDDASTYISAVIIRLDKSVSHMLFSSRLLSIYTRTFAQNRHQLPARPPPSGSSAASVHWVQFSPIRPMMVMSDMLRYQL
jgi:hypothetical protein